MNSVLSLFRYYSLFSSSLLTSSSLQYLRGLQVTNVRDPLFSHTDTFTAMSNLVTSTVLPQHHPHTRDHINIIFSLRDENGQERQGESKDPQSEETKDQNSEEHKDQKRKRDEEGQHRFVPEQMHEKARGVEDQQEDKEQGSPTSKKLKRRAKDLAMNDQIGWNSKTTQHVMLWSIAYTSGV